MGDPTPGTAKAWTGVGASVIGGAFSKLALKIIKLHWPQFLDEDTISAIDVLFDAAAVGIAVYLVPHQLSSPKP